MTQPKYKFGQKVSVQVKTKDALSGIVFTNNIVAQVSEIHAKGTDEQDSYEYGITVDMPRCYHSGELPFRFIMENDLNENLLMD